MDLIKTLSYLEQVKRHDYMDENVVVWFWV